MLMSECVGMLVAVIVLVLCVASGWWAREFVYRLEHTHIGARCELEGSCGDR